jgi:hypothetical protein
MEGSGWAAISEPPALGNENTWKRQLFYFVCIFHTCMYQQYISPPAYQYIQAYIT